MFGAELDERFLPPSLRKQGGKAVDAARPSRPGITRSAALQRAMAEAQAGEKSWGDVAEAGTKAGIQGAQGYGQLSRKGASEADKKAGYANIFSGVASGAGSLLPGWMGKVAQLAGLVGTAYGQVQDAKAKGDRMRELLAIEDAKERAKKAMLWSSQGLI